MKGKGKITIDDIAVGVGYNEEPYSSNKRYSVITPDISSQQKFFTVDNYTHKYLAKEKRSPFVEYLPKKKLIDDYEKALLGPATYRGGEHEGLEEAEANAQCMTERVPVGNQAQVDSVCNQGLEEVRNRSGRVKPGAIISGKRESLRTKKRIHIPKDYTVSNPTDLYVPSGQSDKALYTKTNPYTGSKYYNMLSVLNLDKNKTLRDVIKKSKESESATQEMLGLQKSREYLTSQGLPPVPKQRFDPVIIGTDVPKNPAKKIGNDVHGKMTNGGYARTSYGGYFMQ